MNIQLVMIVITVICHQINQSNKWMKDLTEKKINQSTRKPEKNKAQTWMKQMNKYTLCVCVYVCLWISISLITIIIIINATIIMIHSLIESFQIQFKIMVIMMSLSSIHSFIHFQLVVRINQPSFWNLNQFSFDFCCCEQLIFSKKKIHYSWVWNKQKKKNFINSIHWMPAWIFFVFPPLHLMVSIVDIANFYIPNI